MASQTIPTLPAAIALNGGEELWAVQNGVDVRLTTAQIVLLSSAFSGVWPIAQGGTGQNNAIGAFNALSPITTLGDLIVGLGTNSAGRLGVGANGTVLTIVSGAPAWAVVPAWQTDELTVTATNTLSNLTYVPNGNVLFLVVNGATYFGTGSNAAFSFAATTISWTSPSFNLTPGDVVYAVYTH